jgi:hypothetical protein
MQVRVDVATRQVRERGSVPLGLESWSLQDQLDYLLRVLFKDQPAHLDHDPPLMLRKFSRKTLRYAPDANDPEHLIWRSKEDHRLKTYVRGDGAKYSDAAERRRASRRKKRKTERVKFKWPKRKLKSRSTFARKP